MNCKYCSILLHKFDRTCPKCGAPVPVDSGEYVFNKDWKLRDSMLHWNEHMERIWSKFRDLNKGYDVRYFDQLDAETLEKMIELGFADPAEKQNDAPTIAEFLEWLKDNPDYKAHGYVVTIKRNDYRLSIEGVDGCSTDKRQLKNFVKTFKKADEFEVSKDYQRAWYD